MTVELLVPLLRDRVKYLQNRLTAVECIVELFYKDALFNNSLEDHTLKLFQAYLETYKNDK